MKKLFYGGPIITMESEEDSAEAVLVEDGRISDLGSLEQFSALLDDSTVEKVNLNGHTLLPGFIDPHSHLSMIGPMSVFADLSDCEDLDDIVQTLKDYLNNNELGNDAIYGFGYDHNFLKENSHPTKDILNKVSSDIPILVSHASGHIGCANDAALALGEIDANTKDIKGGHIGRIEGTNEPNGYLEEETVKKLQEVLFTKLTIDFGALAKVGQEIYIKNGITTAQDGSTATAIIEQFKHLADNNELLIDVVVYPQVMVNPDDLYANKDHAKKYHNRLKINGYKLFLDGSPQAKTAWLTEPYEGEESYCGYSLYDDHEVKEFILRAINDDVQLLTHCNGDAASDQLLTNYQAALKESTNPNKHNLRPVMIHCQMVRDDQLDIMKEINMIPSIFVDHTYYWGDIHLKYLGEERGKRISPARSAFDRGLFVNFHQDSPVIQPDMLQTIWSAVNRITRNGQSIGKDERVTVYEALKALTINAAYAYYEEDEKGSITPGKVADLVILDQNPLAIDPLNMRDINILETIKEGKTLYKAE